MPLLIPRAKTPGDEKRMIVLLEPQQLDDWLQSSLENAPSFFQQYDAEKLAAVAAPRPPRKKANITEGTEEALED